MLALEDNRKLAENKFRADGKSIRQQKISRTHD
jgi:hypothetical protein